MRLDLVGDDMFVGGETGEGMGQSSRVEEQPKRSIAKRVRMLPRHCNPFVMQSSPYLHPNQAAGKGQRKCANLYTSQKQLKKHISVSSKKLVRTTAMLLEHQRRRHISEPHMCVWIS